MDTPKTREELVSTWMLFGPRRCDETMRRTKPQWFCDKFARENAEDVIDGLIALGLIKLVD